MKKVFQLEDLDCANCAARMERAIGKVAGVTAVSVNFLTQKLSVEADEAEFDAVMKKVVKAAKRAVPDCTIVR